MAKRALLGSLSRGQERRRADFEAFEVASGHPVKKIAAEVKEFDVLPYLPINQRKSIKVMSRAMQFAVGAASLAVTDSDMDLKKENPEALGVVAQERASVPADRA